MEKSHEFEEDYLSQRDLKVESRREKEKPTRFYHATTAELKPGDRLVPGPTMDEVSLADSPVVHGTISTERVMPDPEIRKAKIEMGKWNPEWDKTWYVYEVKPEGHVRPEPEFMEFRAPSAIVIKKIGNARTILERYLKGEKKGEGSSVGRFDKVRGVKVKGRSPSGYWDQQLHQYLRRWADEIRIYAAEGNIPYVRGHLTSITRDENFLGPDGFTLMVSNPIHREHELQAQSEEKHKVMGMIVSGKDTRYMTGTATELPITDVITLLRQTVKPHRPTSFTITVWDEALSPLPTKDDKKFFGAIKKEFPKIDIRIVFNQHGDKKVVRIK